MSFSVVTSTATIVAAEGSYTYSVMPFRDIMRPELIDAKYKMRLTLTAGAAAAIVGGACHMARVKLGNAIFDMTYDGTRSQYYAILSNVNNTTTNTNYGLLARPEDNVPVVVSNLKDVNTITIYILKNQLPLTTALNNIQAILHFEPIIE